mgnify:CR=1 FL=1
MRVAPWRAAACVAGCLSLPCAAAVTETDTFMANVEKGTHGPNLEKGNWVVAPIPVSNPTMGTGLQLATLYLHPSRDGNGGPNPTSGLGAMYTDTNSWGVGAFHQDYLLDDRLRVTAAACAGKPPRASLCTSVWMWPSQKTIPSSLFSWAKVFRPGFFVKIFFAMQASPPTERLHFMG